MRAPFSLFVDGMTAMAWRGRLKTPQNKTQQPTLAARERFRFGVADCLPSSSSIVPEYIVCAFLRACVAFTSTKIRIFALREQTCIFIMRWRRWKEGRDRKKKKKEPHYVSTCVWYILTIIILCAYQYVMPACFLQYIIIQTLRTAAPWAQK